MIIQFQDCCQMIKKFRTTIKSGKIPSRQLSSPETPGLFILAQLFQYIFINPAHPVTKLIVCTQETESYIG